MGGVVPQKNTLFVTVLPSVDMKAKAAFLKMSENITYLLLVFVEGGANCGLPSRNNVIFKESFCVNDFVKDYNSYKGNAYGMANTLLQTAFLRPKLKSKKVKSLYFTGQLTVPGPGVPPALISGKLVTDLIKKHR
jgi:hypothetical protein